MGDRPDPRTISTDEELRAAIFAMVPHTQDRAVERRSGLGKSSVNQLRRGVRRFTPDALDKLVTAYDPERRAEWLAALERVRSLRVRASEA